MATTVTIDVDCGDDYEVVVTRVDVAGQVWQKEELAVLPNGQNRKFVVNDIRSIHVRERRKDVAEKPRARRIRVV